MSYDLTTFKELQIVHTAHKKVIVITFTIDIFFLTYPSIGTGSDGDRYGSHI